MTQSITSSKLTPADRELLSILGYSASADLGKAYIIDQRMYKGNSERQRQLQADHESSFRNIASLGGLPGVIDHEDMDALRTNPKAVAQVLRNEPELAEIMDGGVLTQEKNQLPAAPEHSRDGIPQVAYKRLVALLQLSLNHQKTDRAIRVNGVFGHATGQAVKKWLEIIGDGRQNYDKPAIAGPLVFGSLIVRNGLDCLDIDANLRIFSNHVAKKGAKYLDQHYASDKAAVVNLVRTLQYLYPAEMKSGINPETLNDGKSSPTDGILLGATTSVLEKHYGAQIIGAGTVKNLFEQGLHKLCPSL